MLLPLGGRLLQVMQQAGNKNNFFAITHFICGTGLSGENVSVPCGWMKFLIDESHILAGTCAFI
jgi:hypothetical protein